MSWTSTYANRGMVLEQVIEISNRQYQARGIAEIQKIPTPVKVLKTDRTGKVYGYWEKKSTVDFIGIYQEGKETIPIAFDAKETKGKSLGFKNIHEHQLEFMVRWNQKGGQAFLVVLFSELNRYFRIGIEQLVMYMRNPLKSNQKSIPIKYFEENAAEIKEGKNMILDYLKGVTD